MARGEGDREREKTDHEEDQNHEEDEGGVVLPSNAVVQPLKK